MYKFDAFLNSLDSSVICFKFELINVYCQSHHASVYSVADRFLACNHFCRSIVPCSRFLAPFAFLLLLVSPFFSLLEIATPLLVSVIVLRLCVVRVRTMLHIFILCLLRLFFQFQISLLITFPILGFLIF